MDPMGRVHRGPERLDRRGPAGKSDDQSRRYLRSRLRAGIFVPALFRGPSESGEELVSLEGGGGIRDGEAWVAPPRPRRSRLCWVVVTLGLLPTARSKNESRSPSSWFQLSVCASSSSWPFWSFRFLPTADALLLFIGGWIYELSPCGFNARRAARCCSPRDGPRGRPCSASSVSSLLDHPGLCPARPRPVPTRRPCSGSPKHARSMPLWHGFRHMRGETLSRHDHPGAAYISVRAERPYRSTGRLPISWPEARDVRYVACFVSVQAPNAPELELVHTSPAGFCIA